VREAYGWAWVVLLTLALAASIMGALLLEGCGDWCNCPTGMVCTAGKDLGEVKCEPMRGVN
jgi:hypothetical protein